MIRVRFTENVDVDISTVPPSAYGALGVRHRTKVPQIADGKFEMVATEPLSKHYFRKDRFANLPDEMAQGYITAGQAVTTGDSVISTIGMSQSQLDEFGPLVFGLTSAGSTSGQSETAVQA